MTSLVHADAALGNRLDGKVAVVTGASGQLGRRVALALGQRGASVALLHRGGNSASVGETLIQLRTAGVPTIEVKADTAGGAQAAAALDAVVEQFGSIDVVVHTPGQVLKKPMLEITDEEFESNLDANIRAAFYLLREAARRINDNGRIITLSTSITAATTPNYGAYAGHKAATEQYVRALAKELGPRGVTVNAVAPGPINSPFYFAVETEESMRAASRYSGANRLGEWDEIVPVIAFLTTPDAHWITAQTIRANGGMVA